MAKWLLRGWSVRLLRAFAFSALFLAALSPFSVKAEESAALTPAVAVDGNGLPIMLSAGDVSRYQEIFALQVDGKWSKADALIAELEDELLLGHVLAQRFLHPTDYRSKYKELKAWLELYADLPEAERIYELAKKRKPSGAANPPAPQISELSVSGPAKPSIQPYKSDRERSSAQRSRVNQIMKEIKALVKDDKLTKAQKLLESAEAQKLLDPVEIDQSYAEIARGWYFEGDNEKALELAGPAATRSGSFAPYANWYAGLAAWRLGDMEQAAHHFESVALSDRANAWVQAAGAYWAARAHLRRRDPGEMSLWLSLAAEYPRTFYGLLAREAMGMKTEFDFRAFRLTTSGVEMLASAPHGARAMALLQVGERELAEQELMMLEVWDSADVAEVLLAIADQAKLARFAFKLANKLADAEGNGQRGMPLLAALYPVPHWEPEGGYVVDRALVYALIRQESAFDPDAKSHAGARGLMQIMPRTASYVAGDPSLKGKGKNELYDPELNLRLGQEYLVHLLTLSEVQGDLFRLCAAYNGGPGNLAKWQRETDFKDDPLLFIESLPAGETRDYIERVLANLWIYSARLEQPTPSLTDIANGDWPQYRSLDSLTAQAQ